MLENTPTQPTKRRSKNRAEINHGARGTSNINSQIKLKTSMLKSSLCDDSDESTLVSGTVTVAVLGAGEVNNNKNVAFKICALFTDCISEINNTQVDNAKDFDILMPMYNLIEYSDNYLKTSRSLCHYYRDDPSLNNAGVDFTSANHNSKLFKYKQKITGETDANGTKYVEIMAPVNI